MQFFTLMVNEQVVRNCVWVMHKKLSCMHLIDVFDPQACDSRIMHVSSQVYVIGFDQEVVPI